jgi:dipeptidyl aminopeptidase/acylaminoacyl peptidase
MAVTVLPQGFSTNEYAQHISGVPRQEDESGTVRASTVTLYRSRTVEVPQLDAWSLDRHLRDLVSIDVDRGFAKTVIHGRRIAKYLPSPDGSRIAFTTDTRFEMPGSQQILFDLSVVNLSTGETRTVASGIRLNADSASLGWSPSGSYLAYQTVGVEANGDCYVVDTNSEQVRKVSNLPQAHSRYQRRAPLWDAASEHVYFLSDGGLWRAAPKGTDAVRVAKILNHRITELIAQNREHLLTGDGGTTTVVMTRNELTEQDGFYAIDLGSGKSTALIEANQCYTCVHTNSLVSASGDGRRFAFVAEDAQHASDVWLADAGFHRVRRLTHLNPDLDKYSMGSVRLIEWQNMDGELVKGALLLPADYREGQRYPLIARVYGGEFLQSDKLNRFGLEQGAVNNLQLLSSRGYAVLLPDAPQKIGTPMLDLAKSVLAGVNKVVEMGIADSNRLGLMGHSYGGYSVLSLIVQTKRFKVAAMSAGFGDLLAVYGQMGDDGSMIGMSLLEHGQGALGGSPWQFPEQYIENSPVFYLNRVQTPLLLLSGSDDNTVASHLSDEIFVDLRRLGKEAEYAKYRGEGHSVVSWSYANQLDYCNRLIEWFDRYLK